VADESHTSGNATTEGDALPRTMAALRVSRWPGWVWAIPLAAVGIVAWLLAREISERGTAVTVTYDDAVQMEAGSTKVVYRGVTVGKVQSVELAADGTHAVVHLDIQRSAEKYLNAGTRFYLEGAKPSLSDPASLKAIVAGPTIQMVPGGGARARSFVGVSGRAPERLAVAIPYRIIFNGPAGELKPGDSVTLQGFTVGEVTDIELSINPEDGAIDTGVGIALDPLRFHIQGTAPAGGDWTSVMNATLHSLVQHDLRARLTQSPPLIGGREIELAVVPNAAPASLSTAGDLLQIPSVEGGGISQFVTAAGDVPIRQIGDNVRAITEQIKGLTSSPHLKSSIAHLDQALSQLDKTLKDAAPQVAPTLRSVRDTVDRLRTTAAELDKTAQAARLTIGADAAAPDGSVQPTLLHVGEAARSIRVLADYLDQHPEALLKGRE
jgi:paraquat-inducible protein B